MDAIADSPRSSRIALKIVIYNDKRHEKHAGNVRPGHACAYISNIQNNH